MEEGLLTLTKDGVTITVDPKKFVSYKWNRLMNAATDEAKPEFERVSALVKALDFAFGDGVDAITEHLGDDASIEEVYKFAFSMFGDEVKN